MRCCLYRSYCIGTGGLVREDWGRAKVICETKLQGSIRGEGNAKRVLCWKMLGRVMEKVMSWGPKKCGMAISEKGESMALDIKVVTFMSHLWSFIS